MEDKKLENMSFKIGINNIFKSIFPWVLLWLIFVYFYVYVLKDSQHLQIANALVYGLQFLADAVIFIASFFAYRFASDRIYKKFLGLMFFSIIIGLFSTEVYNALIHIIGVKNINSKLNVVWVLPYTIFLLVQFFLWSWLLYTSKEDNEAKSLWFAKSSYIISASAVIFSVILTGMYHDLFAKELSVIQISNFILETILFVVLAIALSRSKNRSLSYLASGFLILIFFNLAHRFTYLAGQYYKVYDVAWLLSYIVIIFGFMYVISNSKEKLQFFEKNSIHVLTSTIFILFSTLISILFIILEFFLSSIEKNHIVDVNAFRTNIPSILIFMFLLSILIGKFIALYLSRPLELISRKIDLIQSNRKLPNELRYNNMVVSEIEKLDQFIIETVSQLKIANRIKSEFVMNMSHDFRTPASGIHSMAKTIYRKIDDEDLKKMQQLIIDSSKQLLNFIDDVLDYARLENNAIAIILSDFDIRDVIAETILFFSSKISEKKLHACQSLPNAPIIYHGDKVLVQRILINLISNAVKFTNEGTINISANYNNEAGAVIIIIQDTGIGIDPRYHDAIFEPFYRVDLADQMECSGVGLGLSNVKQMLNKLGGTIRLKSKIGEGAMFTIILPWRSISEKNF